jgi:hypothetical protein
MNNPAYITMVITKFNFYKLMNQHFFHIFEHSAMNSRPFQCPSFKIGVFEIYNGHNPLFKLKENRVYRVSFCQMKFLILQRKLRMKMKMEEFLRLLIKIDERLKNALRFKYKR